MIHALTGDLTQNDLIVKSQHDFGHNPNWRSDSVQDIVSGSPSSHGASSGVNVSFGVRLILETTCWSGFGG